MLVDQNTLRQFVSRIEVDIVFLCYICHLEALLKFIQIYFLREIKSSFYHLSIGKSFYTEKNIVP